MGSPQKDKLLVQSSFSTNSGEAEATMPLSSFHSDSTMTSNNAMLLLRRRRRNHRHDDNNNNMMQSSLDISYDSFMEQQAQQLEQQQQSDMSTKKSKGTHDNTIDNDDMDLNKATYNLWGSINEFSNYIKNNQQEGSNRNQYIALKRRSNHDSYSSTSSACSDESSHESFVNLGRVLQPSSSRRLSHEKKTQEELIYLARNIYPPIRRTDCDNMRGEKKRIDERVVSYSTPVESVREFLDDVSSEEVKKNEQELDTLNRKLQQMKIGKESRSSVWQQSRDGSRRDAVIVEDVLEDEESSCESGSSSHQLDDDYTSESSGKRLHDGKEPPGHTSVTTLNQTDYNPSSDPPVNDDAELPSTSSDGEESEEDAISSSSSYDTLAQEGLDDYLVAFNVVQESSPKLQGRKKLRLHDEMPNNEDRPSQNERKRGPSTKDSHQHHQEPTTTTNHPSILRNSITSRSSSNAESRNSQHSSRKVVEFRDNESHRSPRHSVSQSSSKTREDSTSNSRNNGGHEYHRRESESDSSHESTKSFSNCDAQGRCIHHPHVQLRRKRRIGGWKRGKWKIIMMNCTE